MKIMSDITSGLFVIFDMKGQVRCIVLWDTVLQALSSFFKLHILTKTAHPGTLCILKMCLASYVLQRSSMIVCCPANENHVGYPFWFIRRISHERSSPVRCIVGYGFASIELFFFF